MTSIALERWRTARAERLDELVDAHRLVRRSGPGHRRRCEQITRAYLLAVAAQFQGYCRDVHTEAMLAVVAVAQPARVASQLRVLIGKGRRLGSRNATPGALADDFDRLGLDLWSEMARRDRRTGERRRRLEQLNGWRNALAHENADRLQRMGTLTIADVARARITCSAIAATMDRVVADHVVRFTGRRPW